MRISERLKTVADFVTPGNRVADIGTDHGYVPIYLVKNSRIPGAIAMDIHKGPLCRAKEHIKQEGLEDAIETRLSDGLSAYGKGEADTLVIAGMGGWLTVKILKEGKLVREGISELVLSPQSEIFLVRQYLYAEGFAIEKEAMLWEDGKFYTIIRAVPGKEEEYDRAEALYGRYLLKEKNPVLKEFLMKEAAVCDKIVKELSGAKEENAKRRRQELVEKKAWIQEALSYYNK